MDETHVETGFPRFDQLAPHARIKQDLAGSSRRVPVFVFSHRVIVVQLIGVEVITHFRIRSPHLCKSEPFRHASADLRQHIRNHTREADRRIKIRAVSFRHRRRPVVTSCHVQEQIAVPIQLQRTIKRVHLPTDQLGSYGRLINAVVQGEQVRNQQFTGRSVHFTSLLHHQVAAERHKTAQAIQQIIFACSSQETVVILVECFGTFIIQAAWRSVTAGIHFLVFGCRIIIGTATQFDIEPIGRRIFQRYIPQKTVTSIVVLAIFGYPVRVFLRVLGCIPPDHIAFFIHTVLKFLDIQGTRQTVYRIERI